MTESPNTSSSREGGLAARAEDAFVSMVQQPEFAPYLGRMVEATDEELRSLFGLMMASLRVASRDAVSGPSVGATAAPEVPPRPSREDLESQVRQLASALKQRDEHIRVLKNELEKRHKA